MNYTWHRRFLNVAKLVSSWSKDPSTQTGAVIVRPDKTIVSVGFNGFPQAMQDGPELYANREEKYSRIVHCEVNALIFAREQVKGYTLYTWPFLSCDRCCVTMLQAGISQFVAPIPDQEKLTRWNESFQKTRAYCNEAGAEVIELMFI